MARTKLAQLSYSVSFYRGVAEGRYGLVVMRGGQPAGLYGFGITMAECEAHAAANGYTIKAATGLELYWLNARNAMAALVIEQGETLLAAYSDVMSGAEREQLNERITKAGAEVRATEALMKRGLSVHIG